MVSRRVSGLSPRRTQVRSLPSQLINLNTLTMTQKKSIAQVREDAVELLESVNETMDPGENRELVNTCLRNAIRILNDEVVKGIIKPEPVMEAEA